MEDIQAEYEDVINEITERYTVLVDTEIESFDHKAIWQLIKNIVSILTKLRTEMNKIKKCDGGKRLVIYTIIVREIVQRSIRTSDKIDEDEKAVIENAIDTICGTVLPGIENMFNEMLETMDTNNDQYVSEQEFTQYCNDCCGAACCCCKNTPCCVNTRGCFNSIITCLLYPLLSCCNPRGIQRV